MTQVVAFEAGAIRRVGDILDERGVQSVFLVAGGSSFSKSGAEAALETILAGRQVTRFAAFDPNPKIADVEAALAAYRASPHDIVLAIGGGTAIDIAKLVAVLVNQPGEAAAVARGESPIERDSAPIIAVPTTAGTGTEATHFAVVYVDAAKYSVAHPSMLPAYAVVDPELTHSVPKGITAATGLDALCQAIESLWNVNATDASALFAREGARLAIDNLHAAVQAPTAEVRAAMARASHLAGKAINITKTTAPHAVSYTMTSRWGVPHGHAVSLTLGPMLAFNARATDADALHPAGPDHVRAISREIAGMFGAESADEARESIDGLIRSLDLHTRLGNLGMKRSADRQLLVDTVNTQRLGNHPRQLTPATLRAILDDIA